MSVTGFMYNVNATKALGELELSAGLEGNRSWHNKYKHSAYIYIGGLHPGLTEGDVVIVFSQFGEVVDVNMIRDKATGKSKGFCFICYEDQPSTVLAVDNMNGYSLLGRTIRVDHVEKYKAPKTLDENDLDENGDPKLLEYKATGAEGKGTGVYNVLDGQKKIEEIQKGKKEVVVKTAKIEDEDEAWAKAFESSLKSSSSKKDKKEKKDKKKEKKKDKKAKKKEKKRELKAQKEELKKIVAEAKRLNEEAKKAKEARKKSRRASETPSPSSEDSSSSSSSSS